jgi:cell division protein FtsB
MPPLIFLSRTRLVIVASLLIGSYFLYTAAVGAYRAQQLGEARADAERQLRQLEDQKAYLEAIRAYVASDVYVEQEARRRYGYIREGEIPFVVISPPAAEEEQPAGPWWQRLFPR